MLSTKSVNTSTTNSAPWSEEKKDRMLGYLKRVLEEEEHRKSQVARPKFTHVAVHSETGHKVGHDGKVWRDLETGAEVK